MAFLKGDAVQCVKIKGVNGLTKNKWYNVVSVVGCRVWVENDGGELTAYSMGRFYNLDEKLRGAPPARCLTREG